MQLKVSRAPLRTTAGVASIAMLAAALASGCLDNERARVPVDGADGETLETAGEPETLVTDAKQGFVDAAVNTNSAHELSDLCVTIEVSNGAGELVSWRAVCSSEAGNGSGDLTYVLTCDSSSPRTTVRVWIDSITTATPGLQLRNPCPGEGHDPDLACALEVLCIEDEDVAVTFDLNLAE